MGSRRAAAPRIPAPDRAAPAPVEPMTVTLEHPFRPADGVKCRLTFTRDGMVNWDPFVRGIKDAHVRFEEDNPAGRPIRNHAQKSKRRLARAVEDWRVAVGANAGLNATDVKPYASSAHTQMFHPTLLTYLLRPSERGECNMEPVDADASLNAHVRAAIPAMCEFCAHKGSAVPVPDSAPGLDARDDDASADYLQRASIEVNRSESPTDPHSPFGSKSVLPEHRRVVLTEADRAMLDEAEIEGDRDATGRVDVMGLTSRALEPVDIASIMRVLEEPPHGTHTPGAGAGPEDTDDVDLDLVRAAFRRVDGGQCDVRAVPRHVADLIVAYARQGRVVFEECDCVDDDGSDRGESKHSSDAGRASSERRSACGSKTSTRARAGRRGCECASVAQISERMRELESRVADLANMLVNTRQESDAASSTKGEL